jgi:hypothetical protein
MKTSAHLTATFLLTAAFLLVLGCTRGSPPPTPPTSLPNDFSGVWAGDAGPNLANLKFGAKIAIADDAGAISGEFFNEDPQRPGVYLPTGQIRGVRDGGVFYLTAGTATDLGDAGKLEPQLLLLRYEDGKLVGLRRLQLEGRPAVNEYLILRR